VVDGGGLENRHRPFMILAIFAVNRAFSAGTLSEPLPSCGVPIV
jgi:hypothetical protein